MGVLCTKQTCSRCLLGAYILHYTIYIIYKYNIYYMHMYATVKWCAAVEAEENLTVSFSIIYSLDFFFFVVVWLAFLAIACMYLLCWRSSETSINCILFAGGEAGTWDTQAFGNQITDTNRWRVLSLTTDSCRLDNAPRAYFRFFRFPTVRCQPECIWNAIRHRTGTDFSFEFRMGLLHISFTRVRLNAKIKAEALFLQAIYWAPQRINNILLFPRTHLLKK